MNNSEPGLYNPFFSHIYIEKEVQNHPVTQRITARFPGAVLVEIDHYKDVFNRSRQNYRIQKQSQALILARKQNNLIYEGAPVCQSFGNQHFYYTSSVMNCIYDCEYCYLQGMYPSAHLVVFVNTEDIFEEVEQLLSRHPVYLCVSYDTDLLALEQVLGLVREWIAFASSHQELTLEIRTKSAGQYLFEELKPLPNVIFAWTLSPRRVVEGFEHHTPSLHSRLAAARAAADKGHRVRLCFDPLIYFKGWEEAYQTMLTEVFDKINPVQVMDVSLGVFRISQNYLKRMRNQAVNSQLAHFPYVNDNGVYHYGKELTNQLISFLLERMKEHIPREKIFLWEEAAHDQDIEIGRMG